MKDRISFLHYIYTTGNINKFPWQDDKCAYFFLGKTKEERSTRLKIAKNIMYRSFPK